MSMTRKDFELIASTINSEVNEWNEARESILPHEQGEIDNKIDALHELALSFANKLSADNPRFDRHRFLKACGFGSARVLVNPDELVIKSFHEHTGPNCSECGE